ncbi:hypothetical protein BaRGS_00013980 [Batillaria attramentaria]|uniref:Uncharacterized protein n=1 Tax=Batillaria attramentaria TaxID=370345 RepID=A0ABD0L6F3_9CAEN
MLVAINVSSLLCQTPKLANDAESVVWEVLTMAVRGNTEIGDQVSDEGRGADESQLACNELRRPIRHRGLHAIGTSRGRRQGTYRKTQARSSPRREM